MASRKRRKSKVKVENLRTYFQIFLSFALIFFGAVILGVVMLRNFDFGSVRELETSDQKPEYREVTAKIQSINIPKIKRDLQVEDGTYRDGRWEVSQEGVSFYTDSSLPGEGGNTVLYGHNKARILGGLVDMRKGDRIELRMENGQLGSYEVFEVKTIKPTDVEILNQTSDERLTIYTCTGFLDSARFVVLAKPISDK